ADRQGGGAQRPHTRPNVRPSGRGGHARVPATFSTAIAFRAARPVASTDNVAPEMLRTSRYGTSGSASVLRAYCFRKRRSRTSPPVGLAVGKHGEIVHRSRWRDADGKRDRSMFADLLDDHDVAGDRLITRDREDAVRRLPQARGTSEKIANLVLHDRCGDFGPLGDRSRLGKQVPRRLL